MVRLNEALSRVPSSSNMVFNFIDEVLVVLGWEHRKPRDGQDVVENPKREFRTTFRAQSKFLLNVPTSQLFS